MIVYVLKKDIKKVIENNVVFAHIPCLTPSMYTYSIDSNIYATLEVDSKLVIKDSIYFTHCILYNRTRDLDVFKKLIARYRRHRHGVQIPRACCFI